MWQALETVELLDRLDLRVRGTGTLYGGAGARLVSCAVISPVGVRIAVQMSRHFQAVAHMRHYLVV